MCLEYNGTKYYYGITFTIENDPRKDIHILMTKIVKDMPYMYGGICLNNGLLVNTDKRIKKDAICDIIAKAVNITLDVEKEHDARNPNEPFQPYQNIIKNEPEFYKDFLAKMETSKSVEEIIEIRKKLAPLLEKRKIKTKPKYKIFVLFVNILKRKVVASCSFIIELLKDILVLDELKSMIYAAMIVANYPLLKKSHIHYKEV